MRIFHLIVVCAVLAATAASPAAGADPADVVVRRVGARVVVASHLGINVAYVATSRGVITVDSHLSPQVMRRLGAAMADSLGRDDVAWFVNTHGHRDHSGGNQAFGGDVVGVGHERCAEYIAAWPTREHLARWRRGRELSRIDERLGAMEPSSPEAGPLRARREALEAIAADLDANYVPTPPTLTFDDRTRIDGGDVVADVIYCGAAHTDHDVFVFIPGAAVLFTGDVFCGRTSVCFSVGAVADVPRLLAVVDEILERAPDALTVIPGHGDPFGRDDLVALRSTMARRYAGVEPERSAARRLADGRRLDDASDSLYYDETEFHVLARRYLGRGRIAEAIALVGTALEHRPDSALLHDVLGEAYVLAGDTASARTHYRRSLDLEPANRNAADTLEMLGAGD